MFVSFFFFFFSSRRRHTRCSRDWSSDVCSSDLIDVAPRVDEAVARRLLRAHVLRGAEGQPRFRKPRASGGGEGEREIGRASCRERGEISVGAASLKKKKEVTSEQTSDRTPQAGI